jgi:hypothetical protein
MESTNVRQRAPVMTRRKGENTRGSRHPPSYFNARVNCSKSLLTATSCRALYPCNPSYCGHLDRSYGLRLRGAAGDFLLDAVVDIDQDLANTGEPLLRPPGVGWNGAMRRHEDFSAERLDRIKRFKLVEAVTVVSP